MSEKNKNIRGMLSKVYLIALGVLFVPLLNLSNTVNFIISATHAKFDLIDNALRSLYGVQLLLVGLLMALTFIIAARAASGKGDIKKPLALYFMAAFTAAFGFMLLAISGDLTSCSFSEAKLFGIAEIGGLTSAFIKDPPPL